MDALKGGGEAEHFGGDGFVARNGEEADLAGLAVAGFDGVDEARADVGREGEAVDEDEDGAGEVELEEAFGGGELDGDGGVFGVDGGLVETVVAAAAEFGEAGRAGCCWGQRRAQVRRIL